MKEMNEARRATKSTEEKLSQLSMLKETLER